jgi:uncharacterized protein (DUF1499 family)
LLKRGIPVLPSRAARWSRAIGALAGPVLVLAALGARTGLVPPAALVPVLALGFGLAIVALSIGVYALVDIWHSGAEGAGSAGAGIAYAFPALLFLGMVAVAAFVYPPVTDATTDPGNPPVFPGNLGEAAVARVTAPASPTRLAPRIYRLPIEQVYRTARALVEDKGWRISREARPPSLLPETAVPEEEMPTPGAEDEAVLEALRGKAVMTQSRSEVVQAVPASLPNEVPPRVETAAIEAIAPTLVFAFPDRVVLRLRREADGTRVDMRSTSAIGRHDLGQNARRISTFLAALDAALLAAVAPPDGVEAAPTSPAQPDATAGR